VLGKLKGESMKKLIVLLVCCLLLIIGCSTEENNKSYNMPVENQIKTVPPPGYSIVCDNQGHFGVRNDVIGYIFEDYYGANNEPPKTRQGAIDRAWKSNMQHWLKKRQTLIS